VPSIELTHAYRVGAPPQRILEHLRDPASYIGLPPLVVEVRDVRSVEGVTHYVAVERFRFGRILRHDNVIRVSLRAVDAGLPAAAEIGGEVVSPGGVRMTYRFVIDQAPDGSVVTDTLRLRAPFGLLHYAASQASAVQVTRGRVLAERLA
jgi:hypothetical protein